jgi:hypothetical protein
LRSLIAHTAQAITTGITFTFLSAGGASRTTSGIGDSGSLACFFNFVCEVTCEVEFRKI